METGGNFDPSDLTFAPNFSSTRNFSEMARMASTPFNPSGEMAPLSALAVSTIKVGTESKEANDVHNEMEESQAAVGHAGENRVMQRSEVTQNGESEESQGAQNITKTRRSSMFTGMQKGVVNLR